MQTATDVALEVYGSIEGLFWLAEDNAFQWLFSPPNNSRVVVLRDSVIDVRMRDYLSSYAPFGTYYY